MLEALSVNERMCLAATIDRLIYGDDTTFDLADAAELLRLAPPMTFLSVASTVVSVSVGNAFDSRGRSLMRVGQWKLHNNTSIFQLWRGIVSFEIAQIAGDRNNERRVVRLRYRSGQAIGMFLQTIKPIVTFPILTLATATIPRERWPLWKVPAANTRRWHGNDSE
jgi:hypothetical protein